MCNARSKPSLKEVLTTSRRFVLIRHRDVSGVSGTGVVADGVEFPSGRVALAWRGKPSLCMYDSVGVVEKVHGHNGATDVVFIDDWPPKLKEDYLSG